MERQQQCSQSEEVGRGDATDLLVISKVVPKICARMNSAMMGNGLGERSCGKGLQTFVEGWKGSFENERLCRTR